MRDLRHPFQLYIDRRIRGFGSRLGSSGYSVSPSSGGRGARWIPRGQGGYNVGHSGVLLACGRRSLPEPVHPLGALI